MLRDFVHYICLNLLCLITTSIPFIIVAQTAHHTPTIMSRHGPNVSIWVCQPTSICNFEYSPSPFSGPGSSVGTATELQAGRSGIESRWGRDFLPVQTGPGAHPTFCKMGAGSFPAVKCGRGLLLTTHPLLGPWSWKSRAIPLPTLWATPGL